MCTWPQMTTNPRWPEIISACAKADCKVADRPDIVARVFKAKLESLVDDLRKRHVLGTPAAYMHVVEFQKRGLPHAHILLIVEKKDKISSADQIDAVVSAELPEPPDRTDFPAGPTGDAEYDAAAKACVDLREVLATAMTHRACGEEHGNAKAPVRPPRLLLQRPNPRQGERLTAARPRRSV